MLLSDMNVELRTGRRVAVIDERGPGNVLLFC